MSPSIKPCQPVWIPSTDILSASARRTTARITALRPGQSPPPVSTPRYPFISDTPVVIRRPRSMKLTVRLFRSSGEYIIRHETMSNTQLAIDTSSRLTSLYIARETELLGSLGVLMHERRSERLWTQIDFVLGEAGLRIEDVELFSVCTGPGGFTGIRVGMAAAKGLAMASRRPLIGVTSLEALAVAAGRGPAILAMTRAHQGEVFSQLFRPGSSQAPIAEDDPMVSSTEAALARAAAIKQLIIIGDAANDNIDLIEKFASTKSIGGRRAWELGPSPEMLAPWIARVALVRYSRGEVTGPGEVRATY